MIHNAVGTIDQIEGYERPGQFPYGTEAASTYYFQIKSFQRGWVFPVDKKELTELYL
jgi:hypothetical protein